MASGTATPTRVASSWRALGRMQSYQIPMALGGLLGVLGGIVTIALRLARDGALEAPAAQAIFLIAFGALGYIGYRVSNQNVRNGAIVAGIAGIALALLGGGIGLIAGLICIVGAVWAFAKS